LALLVAKRVRLGLQAVVEHIHNAAAAKTAVRWVGVGASQRLR